VARKERGIVTRVAHVEVLVAEAAAGGAVEGVAEGAVEGAVEGAAAGAVAGAARSRGCGSSITMGRDSALLAEGEALFGRLAADSVGELVD
jgi:hypothetical protein